MKSPPQWLPKVFVLAQADEADLLVTEPTEIGADSLYVEVAEGPLAGVKRLIGEDSLVDGKLTLQIQTKDVVNDVPTAVTILQEVPADFVGVTKWSLAKEPSTIRYFVRQRKLVRRSAHLAKLS